MKLESGDLFATKNLGLLGKLASALMRPKTDRFHFGLIWRKTDSGYLILESIGKGIAVGRLSFYGDADIKFYRVNCPQEIRRKAPMALTKYGRAKYDYLLILKIVIQGFWGAIKNFVWGRGFYVTAKDLTWSHNNSFVCTEAVDIAYLSVGISLTGDICPTPSAFRQAELDGVIEEI